MSRTLSDTNGQDDAWLSDRVPYYKPPSMVRIARTYARVLVIGFGLMLLLAFAFPLGPLYTINILPRFFTLAELAITYLTVIVPVGLAVVLIASIVYFVGNRIGITYTRNLQTIDFVLSSALVVTLFSNLSILMNWSRIFMPMLSTDPIYMALLVGIVVLASIFSLTLAIIYRFLSRAYALVERSAMLSRVYLIDSTKMVHRSVVVMLGYIAAASSQVSSHLWMLGFPLALLLLTQYEGLKAESETEAELRPNSSLDWTKIDDSKFSGLTLTERILRAQHPKKRRRLSFGSISFVVFIVSLLFLIFRFSLLSTLVFLGVAIILSLGWGLRFLRKKDPSLLDMIESELEVDDKREKSLYDALKKSIRSIAVWLGLSIVIVTGIAVVSTLDILWILYTYSWSSSFYYSFVNPFLYWTYALQVCLISIGLFVLILLSYVIYTRHKEKILQTFRTTRIEWLADFAATVVVLILALAIQTPLIGLGIWDEMIRTLFLDYNNSWIRSYFPWAGYVNATVFQLSLVLVLVGLIIRTASSVLGFLAVREKQAHRLHLLSSRTLILGIILALCFQLIVEGSFYFGFINSTHIMLALVLLLVSMQFTKLRLGEIQLRDSGGDVV
ncbi:MAG: hypothetical protein ACFE7R_04920 [Candidatus Hodarchaeota archaeon]